MSCRASDLLYRPTGILLNRASARNVEFYYYSDVTSLLDVLWSFCGTHFAIVSTFCGSRFIIMLRTLYQNSKDVHELKKLGSTALAMLNLHSIHKKIFAINR